MKSTYKHKQGIFGTDSENYISRLFMMAKNPNGSRRPDLISLNKRFKPNFSVEVKSGKSAKGIMVDYQLHYSITSEQDYINLFGEFPLEGSGEYLGENWGTINPFFNKKAVAYYYNLVDRVDGLKAGDIDRPFSSVKLKWGDQFMVPDDFAFYTFACACSRRTGNDIEKIVVSLKEQMKEDCLNECPLDYTVRKGETNSWQNIDGRDILSIFHNDMSLATRYGKERIERLAGVYDLDELKRIQIHGPNKTEIYILAKSEHQRLMNGQLRKVVKERREILEEIIEERKEAEELLNKITVKNYQGLFEGFGDLKILQSNLTREEILKLERLCNWMIEGEEKIELVEDNIPF